MLNQCPRGINFSDSKGKGSTGEVKGGRKVQNGGKWGYGYESGYAGGIGPVNHESEVRFQKEIAVRGAELC